jgi:hypothetical protein
MISLAALNPVVVEVSHRVAPIAAPPLDGVMLFGFLAAVLTLVCWLHRDQSSRAAGAFAVCLAAMAVYGFLQGAWPLGMILGVRAGDAFCRRGNGKAGRPNNKPRRLSARTSPQYRVSESRMSRMFGPR